MKLLMPWAAVTYLTCALVAWCVATDCTQTMTAGIVSRSRAAEERPTPLGGPGTLSVTDERTGKAYKLKLDDHGHLKANDLKQITAGGDGVGLRTYDPG